MNSKRASLEVSILGHAMSAFFGGRAEERMVRTPVPVSVLDVRSTYPTIATLLGVQDFLFAERVEVTDTTADTRSLLGGIDLAACLESQGPGGGCGRSYRSSPMAICYR